MGRLLVLLAAVAALVLPATAVAAPALVVERSGGIAGVQDRLTLDKSGAAVVTHRDGKRSRVAASRTRILRSALQDARLSSLKGSYEPKLTVNDGFTYVLKAGGHTVRVEEGAEGVPKRLQRLIESAAALLLS
jgi:hypothetical protein